MVGKSQIKFIKSLQQKKYRNQHRMFVVEGIKTVQELLDSSFEPHKVYAIAEGTITTDQIDIELISEPDLLRMSSLKNPNKVLGVFKFPEIKTIKDQGWILALDDVRDPGNLGTIIRLCDWFGIKQLVCSENTVDCYNPKVLQATMGSITRVDIVYTDLIQFIKASSLPVYGTFMDGADVHTEKMPEKGILVMGNEANGISKAIENLVDQKISIPQFGSRETESLNVATATAIFLNEIRRVGK
ncbi:TrmH family RNA methyltransferase [Maribacter polysaccharolyticus]|uniref:TrmH family RNA methyltransferase n=1 Tax=Maribacter polysaccharolyticus TaxID=3020831 RepID=UPI00237FC19B|nr:RNA methyltransferase [Maribacter polysaccharolyticus]MDE3743653.1 RNA methyltransferase [Maribacter polysaccharolyticus]